MIIDASVGKNRKACLSTHCEKLKLTAAFQNEAHLLAAIFRAMSRGGIVSAVPAKGEAYSIEFPEPESAK